jgi:hypothetical protein
LVLALRQFILILITIKVKIKVTANWPRNEILFDLKLSFYFANNFNSLILGGRVEGDGVGDVGWRKR